MRRHPSPVASALLALGAVLASAGAAVAAEPGIAVQHPWFRFILPARPAGGYFTLANHGATPRVLVGAASPACEMVVLHRSMREGGMDRMATVQNLPVPAHGEVVFGPGGYHLMCMAPKDMAPGRSVPVTLRFRDGGSITADFPVRGPGGR